MILPNDERCREVLDELASEPNLTEFEAEFIDSNAARSCFTDKQKEVIAGLIAKFDV